MTYVIEREPDVLEAISGAFQSGSGEDAVNHPAEWLGCSTAADRDALRIHLVDPAEVPAGMIVVARRYGRVGGVVTEILDLAPAPVIVPASVTPRQLRLALLGEGKLAQVQSFVDSGAAPPEAVISWEYATEFLRSDPMLNQLAAVLDPPLAPAEIDALFVAAAQIP